MTTLTSADARELHAAFRDTITGAAPGPVGARGPLLQSLRAGDGWRSDWLWVSRAILRQMLEGFASDSTQSFRAVGSAEEVAQQLSSFWGLERYPLASSGAAGSRMAEWTKRVYESGPALDAAEREAEKHATLRPHTMMSHQDPLFWAEHRPEEWPPPGPVRRQLIDAVRERVTLPTALNDTDEQFVQILRRRAATLHQAYLSGNRAVKTRFWHLRHSIVRPWFQEDLLDLRDDDQEFPAEERPSSDPRVARSQAAVAMLTFHAAIREWDPVAYDSIVTHRIAAFRSAEEPILRYIRQGLESGSTVESDRAPAPSLSGLEHLGGSDGIHRLMRLVLTYRRARDPRDAATYVRLRDNIKPPNLSAEDRRLLLLIDQAMHLTVVGGMLLDSGTRDKISVFLEQSARERLEYRAFVFRDKSLQEAKTGRLGAAMSEGYAGQRALRTHAADRDFQSGDRVIAEVEHQMNLLMAGNAVKVVEAMMRQSTTTRARTSHSDEVIRARSAAAVGWASLAMERVQHLEANGWLPVDRYHEPHLGEASWRTQTRIIWHRCLCAAFTMQRAYGLRSTSPFAMNPWMDVAPGSNPLADVTEAALDKAFIEMTSMVHFTPAQLLNIAQATLWHSFLRGRRVSFDMNRLSDVLTDSDYLTPSSDPQGDSVTINSSRVLVATGRLLAARYDFGAIEFVPRGSLVWKALTQTSHGGYPEWRNVVALLRAKSRD